MQSIRSLIAVDDQARFRSDVQLDLFDDIQENLALLKSYLFTVAAPNSTSINSAKMVSSVDLLNQLIEAFVNSRVENRLVTIANYGHGKSHLALALANYFSKPVTSEEIKLVQDKLEHALNDPAKSSRFHDFKQERGEFLVVRLRGDTPSNLREQFIPSLEKALGEHQASANIKPPLWHEYAEKILESLSSEELDRANERLAVSRLDVPTLIAQVHQRKDVREHCIEALTSAKNMAPNLGAQLSLRETIEWVADNVCGEGKPLAGMVIMFDEFSLYVSRYAQRNAVGELQDLLNGVSNRPTKVVFLAFAQHDPITVADNAPLSDHGRDTLKHELTRIPKKLVLHTLMESVLDAYLRQRESIWLQFSEERNIRLSLESASHIAYESFLSRYMNGLQWSQDKFDKIVMKGCFPLHPLTTVLLCNLKFSSSGGMGDPRTVLGFVMEHLTAKLDQLLVITNEINWVYPISLVDYFEESISPEAYRIYQSARRNINHDFGDDQRSVLKALFLQEAAQITLTKDTQEKFVASATGLLDSSSAKALRALSDNNIIRYDAIRKTYSFWPANTDPGKLERLLRTKMEKMPFDLVALEKLNIRLANEYGYCIPMNLSWGHPEDWAANQVVLTRDYFERDLIRSFIKPFTTSVHGIEDGTRGLVIWLLARNEEDIRWFQENAESILNQALTDYIMPPVLVLLPKELAFDLIESFRRSFALQELTQNERSVVGSVVYEHEILQNSATIKVELSRIIGKSEDYLDIQREPSRVMAPVAFLSSILALRTLTIKNALSNIYGLAYRSAPREFFTQYRVSTQGNNNLRNAVKQVAGVFFTGQTGNLTSSISTNAIARDLCSKYLVQKWGILSSEHILQRPTDIRLRQAWDFLDAQFSPDAIEKALVAPLLDLMNPPYGYDYNTVTLVFAAWFGYHSHDLQLKVQGRNENHSILSDFLQKGPRDLLQNCKVRNVAVMRRNPDEVRLVVRSIIEETTNDSFTEEEAENALVKLKDFSNDMRNNLRDREEAQAKFGKLQAALGCAKEYGKQATLIQAKIETESNYRGLLDAQKTLSQLPILTLVKTSAPKLAIISQAILSRLQLVVDIECKNLEKPERNTQIELNERQLIVMRDTIKRTGITHVDARIESSLDTLRQAAQNLTRKQSEEEVRTEISGIDSSGSLNYLADKIKRLQHLDTSEPEILTLRDQKVQYLTNEINGLENQVHQIQIAIDTATSYQKIENIRDGLLRSSVRYQDSSYEKDIKFLLERASQLREFFQKISDLHGQPLHRPDDLETMHQRCDEIQSHYKDVLSKTQFTVVEQLKKNFDEKLVAKQQEATVWLQNAAIEVRKDTNIAHIIEKLSNPPVFLPKTNLSDLEQLRALVQKRIDNDALLQVEKIFRTIADRKSQEECLQRLTKIINEQPANAWAFWRRKV